MNVSKTEKCYRLQKRIELFMSLVLSKIQVLRTKMLKQLKLLCYVILLAYFIGLTASAVISHNTNNNINNYYKKSEEENSDDTISIVKHCIQDQEIVKCLKKKAINKLENIIHSNDSWTLTDYVTLQRDPKWREINDDVRDFNDSNIDQVLRTKIDNFVESRMLQIKPSDIVRNILAEEDENQQVSARKGGKKKGGKGGMFFFSGFAIIALIAQMIMGKVAFLAGTAVVLAKVSLFVSLLVRQFNYL